ncbi:gfo/Idh/MocA family oxidoreductase [candidate division KSB1 bacterium]|nr:gfo/Idh/MocA family oxidoreductase [candidate division KSB1 bacterium]
MDLKSHQLDRRAFLEKSTKLAMATSALTLGSHLQASAQSGKKLKLALVGTGSRGSATWGRAVVERYSDQVEYVALCDINPERAEYAKKYMGVNVPVYHATDFERMIQEARPDTVIVTTTDCFHAHYATRAMELGCDVICEKPLATEAEQCQKLLDTEKATGKKLIVTFNARHGTTSEAIKKIIAGDELGRIISAEFQEYLDISHGASYFRRWHGKIRFSGSLLVHKASHHFDQMNWWLDAEPEEVHAFGKVAFYGKNHSFRSRNCRSCPYQEKCDFYWDITQSQRMMDLYVAHEEVDGYLRDGCVWDNDIDSYDSMTVEVKYRNGVILGYSLNAYMPYEGQFIAFNGEKGRLDVFNYPRPWEPESPDFRLSLNFKEPRTWTPEPPKDAHGGHGGMDGSLKDLIFLENQKDPLEQLAGSRAGVMSSLIGIAARKSIETGERVKIADLIDIPLAWRF